ncbi:MAG: class III signal peptide-containing protein [Candidatus Hadarchaeota archaeon]
MKCKKGQGATEYLLMLAAVLVIVAIAVYYVTSAGAGPTLSFTAENSGANVIVTFSAGTTSYTPSWEWAIETGGTIGSYSTTTTDIAAGTSVTVAATADAGDVFWIRIGSSTYKQTITNAT